MNSTFFQFDANVVIVHWPGGSQEIFYPKSASNTRSIGTLLLDYQLIIDYRTNIPPI